MSAIPSTEQDAIKLRAHSQVLTPAGRAAVATVVVKSVAIEELLDAQFCPSSKNVRVRVRKPHGVGFGRWISGPELVEEVVVRRSSLTRLEIHCHGGSAASAAIRESVDSFLHARDYPSNDRMVDDQDQTYFRAEAIEDLSRARTLRVATHLLAQANGSLEGFLQGIVLRLNDPKLHGASLDEVTQSLVELRRRADIGMRFVKGWSVVLSGPPNVGKSSLLNAMLGYDRSIVHSAPGSTRDVVSGSTAIGGWPVELSDTAGMRKTDSEIESQGVALAQKAFERSDIALVIVDATLGLSESHRTWLSERQDAIVVANKCDLTTQRPSIEHVPVSAKTGEGIDLMLEAIRRRIERIPLRLDDPIPFRNRHVELLDRSLKHIRNARFRDATDVLRQLIGFPLGSDPHSI